MSHRHNSFCLEGFCPDRLNPMTKAERRDERNEFILLVVVVPLVVGIRLLFQF